MKPLLVPTGCMEIRCYLEKMRCVRTTDPATGDDPDGRTSQTRPVKNTQTDTFPNASDTTLERGCRRFPTRCSRSEDPLGTAFTRDSNGVIKILIEIKRPMQGDGQAEGASKRGQVPRRLLVQMVQMIDEPQNDSMGARPRRCLDVGTRLRNGLRGDEEVRGTTWPDERDHFHGGRRDDSDDLTQPFT